MDRMETSLAPQRYKGRAMLRHGGILPVSFTFERRVPSADLRAIQLRVARAIRL
jgi:hypothetical protein